MIYPCKTCTTGRGDCHCINWQRWFAVEYEAAAEKLHAATCEEPKPAPPKVSHREIVFRTIFTRLWR
nr:MAG TPA: hypothetical protein [Caudoviricetes sp.]